MNISQRNGTVPANSGHPPLKRPSTFATGSGSTVGKLFKSAASTVTAVISSKSNLITNYLFGYGNRVVFQVRNDKFLPADLKHELMTLYQLSFPHGSKHTHGTPINQRNIELIHILPALAQTDHFFEKLNSHAMEFFSSIDSTHSIDDKNSKPTHSTDEKNIEWTHSIDVQMALWDAGPFKTFSDIGKFLDSIMDKNNDNKPITYNEKIAFKYLLTSLLKMDHHLDADNSIQIINTLSKYFHPDKSSKNCDLYLCILSKAPRLAKVIKDIWNINNTTKPSIQTKDVLEMPAGQLISLIKKLNENKNEFPKIFDRYQFRQNIKARLITLDSLDQKESLLMTLIKYNEQALLEALMGRKDFNIDELSIFGETPLVYAIKQRSQWVINLLIKKQDIDPTWMTMTLKS